MQPARQDMAGEPSPDPSLAVLQERARLLARPLEQAADADEAILTFIVAGERYAVEVGQVREVVVGASISRLPWASSVLAGVTNVRGSIVVVADMTRVLGRGDGSSGGAVVILEGGGQPLGLLVDVVEDVIGIAVDSLLPPPNDVRHPTPDLVLGMSPSAVVLDAAALLNDRRLTNRPQEDA